MYPRDFFAETHEHVPQTAFVLMPFDDRFDTVYESIRSAVLEAGFSSCQRADDVTRGGHIMADVLKGIADAEVEARSRRRPDAHFCLCAPAATGAQAGT
jgi:hypothetical protein